MASFCFSFLSFFGGFYIFHIRGSSEMPVNACLSMCIEKGGMIGSSGSVSGACYLWDSLSGDLSGPFNCGVTDVGIFRTFPWAWEFSQRKPFRFPALGRKAGLAFSILGAENKVLRVQYPVCLHLLIGPFFVGQAFFQTPMPGCLPVRKLPPREQACSLFLGGWETVAQLREMEEWIWRLLK